MSENSFEGRTAVVTGASRGIGAGLVDGFREAGVRVAGCARTLPRECELAREGDVTDGAAVEGFCEEVAREWGPIDLWVNNAGILEPVAPLRDLSAEDKLCADEALEMVRMSEFAKLEQVQIFYKRNIYFFFLNALILQMNLVP